MSKAKRTALVTGASGLAGGYMLTHLLEQGGWDIVAVSRYKPRTPGASPIRYSTFASTVRRLRCRLHALEM